MNEDLSHDLHLRAALRHAPDHALAPPAGVSQTILNAARHVHKPARPAATPAPPVRITVAPPRAVAWLRHWFASPRLAGGLATGLVAALGLGLWIDLGNEPVLDRAPRAADELRVGEAAPAARAPAPEARSAAQDDVHDAPAKPAAPSVGTEPVGAKRLQLAAEAKAERERAPAPPPQRREAGRNRDLEGALAKNAPNSAGAPAAAPAPQPAAPVPEPAPSVAEAAETAPQQTAPDTMARNMAARSDSRSSLAAARAAALGARASAPEAAAEGAVIPSPAFTLLRRARAENASGTARWTWMPPGKAAIVPMDSDADAWLARVTQSRVPWTDTIERAGPGDALEARWWRDDWPQATLRIEADGLRWIEHSGRIRYAPLDHATLQRLRNP